MLFSRKSKQTLTRDKITLPGCSIGDYTYGEPLILQYDQTTHLTIGKFCSISDKVTLLLGGNHRSDWISTYPFPAFKDTWPEAATITGHPASKGDIVIGNDVWLAYGATVLSGVTVGSGAIIGACSVISKDVEPYTIMVGNPAREMKKRFDDATISKLLKLAWWDWPAEKIRANVQTLCSNRIQQLLATT